MTHTKQSPEYPGRFTLSLNSPCLPDVLVLSESFPPSSSTTKVSGEIIQNLASNSFLQFRHALFHHHPIEQLVPTFPSQALLLDDRQRVTPNTGPTRTALSARRREALDELNR